MMDVTGSKDSPNREIYYKRRNSYSAAMNDENTIEEPVTPVQESRVSSARRNSFQQIRKLADNMSLESETWSLESTASKRDLTRSLSTDTTKSWNEFDVPEVFLAYPEIWARMTKCRCLPNVKYTSNECQCQCRCQCKCSHCQYQRRKISNSSYYSVRRKDSVYSASTCQSILPPSSGRNSAISLVTANENKDERQDLHEAIIEVIQRRHSDQMQFAVGKIPCSVHRNRRFSEDIITRHSEHMNVAFAEAAYSGCSRTNLKHLPRNKQPRARTEFSCSTQMQLRDPCRKVSDRSQTACQNTLPSYSEKNALESDNGGKNERQVSNVQNESPASTCVTKQQEMSPDTYTEQSTASESDDAINIKKFAKLAQKSATGQRRGQSHMEHRKLRESNEEKKTAEYEKRGLRNRRESEMSILSNSRRNSAPITPKMLRRRFSEQLILEGGLSSFHDFDDLLGVPENDEEEESLTAINARKKITLRRHYYPEGGWGWTIVFVAVLMHLLAHGLQLGSGVIMSASLKQFHQYLENAGTIKDD